MTLKIVDSISYRARQVQKGRRPRCESNHETSRKKPNQSATVPLNQMIDRGVGKASLVRASNSPTGRTLSRTVSHREGAPATPFAPTNPPSTISSALGPPGSDGISGIKRQSAGIPDLGETILFKPRRSSASLENLNAERPSKKRRLVPPPRQRLPTNFDLDVNSTPLLFPPSRKLKIAEAARIDVSELSEETKRIMGYAVERPVDDDTFVPILGAQTDEVKTQASPVSRFSAGKTISAARAKLANGAGAKYNIKSTSESLTEDVSSIEMNPFVRIRPRFNMPVKDRTARPYIQLPREKKAQQDSTAQTIAGTKGEHLTAAVAQAEEEDIQAADDGERNA